MLYLLQQDWGRLFEKEASFMQTAGIRIRYIFCEYLIRNNVTMIRKLQIY